MIKQMTFFREKWAIYHLCDQTRNCYMVNKSHNSAKYLRVFLLHALSHSEKDNYTYVYVLVCMYTCMHASICYFFEVITVSSNDVSILKVGFSTEFTVCNTKWIKEKNRPVGLLYRKVSIQGTIKQQKNFYEPNEF